MASSWKACPLVIGHENSVVVLDLYYTMFDDTAQTAIRTIRYEQKPLTK